MSRRPGSRVPLVSLLVALTLVLLLGLVGCGDDGGSDDGGDDDRSGDTTGDTGGDTGGDATGDPEEAAPADGECRFLTAEAASAALGTEMELTTAGPQTCYFGPGDAASELEVVVNEVPLAIDAESYAEQAREVCEGEITEVDVPDAVDAYACTAFTTQGFLYVDGTSLVVDVNGAPDDATGVAHAAALLPELTVGGGS